MRAAVPVALAVAVAAASLAPAQAAPRKKKPAPVKREYELTLRPFPDATEDAACKSTLRSGLNLDVHALKVSGPGKLVVKVTGFTGDWDVAVYDSAGRLLRQGWGSDTPGTITAPAPVEDLWYRSTKAQTLHLRVCNVLGSERATVSYTYTYS